MASQARGVTTIRGASELRLKESDRIEAVSGALRAMGCDVETYEDGLSLEGPVRLNGAEISTMHDHRIAMAFTVADLIADGITKIDDASAVNVSFPKFYKDIKELMRI
jgi:3-phosphoshikimate 1-carboxyvinyltransferase